MVCRYVAGGVDCFENFESISRDLAIDPGASWPRLTEIGSLEILSR